MTVLETAPPRVIRRRSIPRRTVINYWLDAGLLIAFVVDMNVAFTGLAVHEWLGLGLGVAFAIHLVRHADWVERTGRRWRGRLPARERLRWIVDAALFVTIVLLITSGILISRAAIPSLGTRDHFWSWLHVETAQWTMLLTAIHLGLSWRWIVKVTRSLAGRTTTRRS